VAWHTRGSPSSQVRHHHHHHHHHHYRLVRLRLGLKQRRQQPPRNFANKRCRAKDDRGERGLYDAPVAFAASPLSSRLCYGHTSSLDGRLHLLDGRCFDATQQALFVGGFLHASMSNLQNPHVRPLEAKWHPWHTGHLIQSPYDSPVPAPSLLHRAELPYPCALERCLPASPPLRHASRRATRCFQILETIMDRLSMRGLTPVFAVLLTSILSGSSTVECRQAFLSE
jgi:hypothetical protein